MKHFTLHALARQFFLPNSPFRRTKTVVKKTDQLPINLFKSIAFPVMRRVFAGLISNQIVGIQPYHLNPFRRTKIAFKANLEK